MEEKDLILSELHLLASLRELGIVEDDGLIDPVKVLRLLLRVVEAILLDLEVEESEEEDGKTSSGETH